MFQINIQYMILQLIAVNRREFHDFVMDFVFLEGSPQQAGKGSNAQNMEMKCIHAKQVNHHYKKCPLDII